MSHTGVPISTEWPYILKINLAEIARRTPFPWRQSQSMRLTIDRTESVRDYVVANLLG
jgi:hypothetical protein